VDLPGFSFIALGDTGKPPDWRGPLSPALRVARAVMREDRRAPIDTLVLLGDNFYPNGLHERELAEQLGIWSAYCRFIDFSALGARMLGSVCDERTARHVVPIVAGLGNHDVKTPEGGALRSAPAGPREQLAPSGAGVLVRPGLSLITLDSRQSRRDLALRCAPATQGRGGWWRPISRSSTPATPVNPTTHGASTGHRERALCRCIAVTSTAFCARVPVRRFTSSRGGSDARPSVRPRRLFASAELGLPASMRPVRHRRLHPRDHALRHPRLPRVGTPRARFTWRSTERLALSSIEGIRRFIELSGIQSMVEPIRPFFIGGCARSGTTMLGAMLGAHRPPCTPESQFKTDVPKSFGRPIQEGRSS
jgi:hypothetical protein